MSEDKADFQSRLRSGCHAPSNGVPRFPDGEQMSPLGDGFALLVPLIIAASVGVICMTFVLDDEIQLLLQF